MEESTMVAIFHLEQNILFIINHFPKLRVYQTSGDDIFSLFSTFKHKWGCYFMDHKIPIQLVPSQLANII